MSLRDEGRQLLSTRDGALKRLGLRWIRNVARVLARRMEQAMDYTGLGVVPMSRQSRCISRRYLEFQPLDISYWRVSGSICQEDEELIKELREAYSEERGDRLVRQGNRTLRK